MDKKETITLELDISDLIAMVRGITPSYNVMNHPHIKHLGTIVGGHGEQWIWHDHLLMQCSNYTLYGIYLICRNGWREINER